MPAAESAINNQNARVGHGMVHLTEEGMWAIVKNVFFLAVDVWILLSFYALYLGVYHK